MPKDRFPGFAKCLRLMRSRDGLTSEEGFHALKPRVAQFVEPLMAEFRAEEKNHGLRCWLLELIGEARDPRALPLLTEQLGSPDERFRYWAAEGLRALDTPEARKVLWEVGLAPTGRKRVE